MWEYRISRTQSKMWRIDYFTHGQQRTHLDMAFTKWGSKRVAERYIRKQLKPVKVVKPQTERYSYPPRKRIKE